MTAGLKDAFSCIPPVEAYVLRKTGDIFNRVARIDSR